MPERFLPPDDSSPDDACEALARRALGAALNRFWSADGGNADELSFPRVDPSTANGAVEILLARVPQGPERDEAVEILRRTIRSTARSAGDDVVDGVVDGVVTEC